MKITSMYKSFNPKTNALEVSAEFLFYMFSVCGLPPERTMAEIQAINEEKYKEFFFYNGKLHLVER